MVIRPHNNKEHVNEYLKHGLLFLISAVFSASLIACSGGSVPDVIPCKTSEECPTDKPVCENEVCVISDTPLTKCNKNEDCASGETCTNNICVKTIDDPGKCGTDKPDRCDGDCFDLKTSSEHCGGCFQPCPEGSVCSAGTCKCPNNSPNVCSGTCTNFQTDPNHCGGCGKVCGAHQECKGGKCECKATWLDCDAANATGCECPTSCKGAQCNWPANCTNGQQDGDETGVDCGGKCPACSTGGGCETNDDCAFDHVCRETSIDTAKSCVRGCIINSVFYEPNKANPSNGCQMCDPAKSRSAWSAANVGSKCRDSVIPPWGECQWKDACALTADKLTRAVTEFKCTGAGTCAGTSKTETQACLRPEETTNGQVCGNGHKQCQGGTCQCVTGYVDCDLLGTNGCECSTTLACTSKICKIPAHCVNKVKDADETDVDCGGKECAPCGDRKTCTADGDCGGGRRCIGGKCLLPCDPSKAFDCEDVVEGSIDTWCGSSTGKCNSCSVGYSGKTNCDGTFECEINLKTDSENCGKCGFKCTDGKECVNGLCKCPEGEIWSGTRCVTRCDQNIKHDCEGSNIGNSGNACTVSGKCEACTLDYNKNCDGFGSNGCEVNTRDDSKHCGACNHACDFGEKCSGGKCICDTGFTNCPLSAVPANCCDNTSQSCDSATNMCIGNKCDPAVPNGPCDNNPNLFCNVTECKQCDTGKLNCDKKSINGCEVNKQNDPNNCGSCGNKCTGGKQCSNGLCKCPANTSDVNGVCKINCSDTMCEGNTTMPDNKYCSASGVCVDCLYGDLKNCDKKSSNGCEINIKTNSSHCGGCNKPCSGGRTCQNGACACPSGKVWNGSSCVNECSSTASFSCSGGIVDKSKYCDSASKLCFPCQSGSQNCDGVSVCENLQTNQSHCGTCGHACGAGQTCQSGQCTCTTAGTTTCGTSCCSSTQYCDTTSNTCKTKCGANDPGVCGDQTNYCGTDGKCYKCTANARNCDGKNNCEVVIMTDNNNCGGCNIKCGANQQCGSVTPGICTCTSGHGNCDGSNANGCEISTTNNTSHCGGCNQDCDPGQYCNASSCQCTTGLADCTGTIGCETNITNNNSHCGGCNSPCQNVVGGWTSCSYSDSCDTTASKTRNIVVKSCTNSQCATQTTYNESSTDGCATRIVCTPGTHTTVGCPAYIDYTAGSGNCIAHSCYGRPCRVTYRKLCSAACSYGACQESWTCL